MHICLKNHKEGITEEMHMPHPTSFKNGNVNSAVNYQTHATYKFVKVSEEYGVEWIKTVHFLHFTQSPVIQNKSYYSEQRRSQYLICQRFQGSPTWR